MKEIVAQTPFVGKIINCMIHNRSFQIEQGDELIPIRMTSARRGCYYIYKIKCPCGCEVRIS